ncbi:MAG: hypothetical protein PQJ58_08610 [Spirochaetales bacterium]|nr:hypothetical protein [Spirochaetales bacterium]
MSTNDFERSCKQLRKKYNFESSPELLEQIKELFGRSLGQPEELALDIFDYIMAGGDLEDSHVTRLSDMIDLFQMDYDEGFNSLETEDWSYLKDLVNGWALEMDMDVVTYVMQRVVDAGAFS